MNYFKPINYIYKKDKKNFLFVIALENITTLVTAFATIKLGELIKITNYENINIIMLNIAILSLLSIIFKIWAVYQLQVLIKKIKLKIIEDIILFNRFFLIGDNKYELLTTIRLADNLVATLVSSSMGLIISIFGIGMFSSLIINQLKSIFSAFFILLSLILIMVMFLYIRKKLKEATQELMRNVNIRDTISDKIINNSKEIIFNAGEDFILHKSLNLNLPVANSYLKLGFYQNIPSDIIRYISIIIFTIIIYISIFTGNDYVNILSTIIPLFLLSPYVLRLMTCLAKNSSVLEFIKKIETIKMK